MKTVPAIAASFTLLASAAWPQNGLQIAVTPSGSQPSSMATENFTGVVRVDDRFQREAPRASAVEW